MLVEVAPQVQPEAEVVDAGEAGLEVLVPQHLCGEAAFETLGWLSLLRDSDSKARWRCRLQIEAIKQGSCAFVKGRVPGMSGTARRVPGGGSPAEGNNRRAVTGGLKGFRLRSISHSCQQAALYLGWHN